MDIKEIEKELQYKFQLKKIDEETKALNNNGRALRNRKYAELEFVKREITFRIGRLKFLGNNQNEIDELQEQLQIIKKNQEKILATMGLNFSSLKPNYSCKKCKDSGYINGRMCDCFKKERNYEIIKGCGIEKGELVSFDDIDEKLIKDEKQLTEFKKLKNLLQKWCDSYPNQNKNCILLIGATGLGKTYLTKCMANSLLEKNLQVCYVSAFEMNNIFLKYHSSFGNQRDDALIPLIESDVLFIDDLGSEPFLKNVSENYLYIVLSERERFKRPTIITSNFDLEKIILRYGERIYSRLVNRKQSFVFNIKGDDLRVNKI